MPLWVDFRNVPDYLFSHAGLRFLGDIVGDSQRLHSTIEKCIRLDVARVLVIVNLDEAPVEQIQLTNEPKPVLVSFPWLPPKCSLCSSWGHKNVNCKKKQVLTSISDNARTNAPATAMNATAQASQPTLAIHDDIASTSNTIANNVAPHIDPIANNKDDTIQADDQTSSIPPPYSVTPPITNLSHPSSAGTVDVLAAVIDELANTVPLMQSDPKTSTVATVSLHEPALEKVSEHSATNHGHASVLADNTLAQATDTEDWSIITRSNRQSSSPSLPKQSQQTIPPSFSPSRFFVLAETKEDDDEKEEGHISDADAPPKDQQANARYITRTKVKPSNQQQGPTRKQQKTQLTKKKHCLLTETLMIMLLFAWNTRGFNQSHKHNIVRNWIRSTNPRFGCLLETHVQSDNFSRIMQVAMPGWNAIHNYSSHRLGRIWVCWCPDLIVTPILSTAQVISVLVTLQSGTVTLISCVYASNFQAERVQLWHALRLSRDMYGSSSLPWLIYGDFNEILAASEHSNYRPSSRLGMLHFQDFVTSCDLTDLAYVGPRFTWWNHRDEDPIGKKLDRALVNDQWSISHPTSYTVFEANGVSDHARCVVHLSSSTTSIRKPFKFPNFIIDNPRFLQVIGAHWTLGSSLYPSRVALRLFHLRLKSLKLELRQLNSSDYSDLPGRTRAAFDILCSRQNQALTTPSAAAFLAEREAASHWHDLAQAEEAFYRQKSRINWLRHGDHNTTFFHRIANSRASRNSIKRLRTSTGEVITDLAAIKSAAVNHFKSFLQAETITEPLTSPSLQDLLHYRCSSPAATSLCCPVLAEEIKATLFSLPTNKAPGPDGYTAEFFKASWTILGNDLVAAIQSFFIYGFLPRGVNATLVSLIPKGDNPETLKDYRPISCCNILYKIISKILANRLKPLLPEFIAPNQSAFVKDRLLLENVVLATELVKDYHKHTTSPRCTLKLDISKAFDTINWQFILSVLQVMNFPRQFIHWIHLCLSTATFSISVNGEPAGYFPSCRGIRQGCALSPYLYVIANNVLSKLLDAAASSGQFGYHPHCREIGLTHLCFADDILVFSDGLPASLLGILQVMERFGRASGLQVNITKSSLFSTGQPHPTLLQTATSLGFRHEELPVRYLGLPLTTKRLSRTDYLPLIDRIRTRMSSWAMKLLSFAGRLQLIKSVVVSTVNFWQSAFRLPRSCVREIESLCSNFLWSGSPTNSNQSKLAWKDVCTPLSSGGLGIRRFEDTSIVFTLSLIWRLHSSTDSLWADWIRLYLLRGSTFWDPDLPQRGSWIWGKLLKLRPLAATFLQKRVFDGKTTSFWYESWSPHGILSDIAGPTGPREFNIPRNATVAEAALPHRWRLRRSRVPHLRQLHDQILMLPLPRPQLGPDQALWRHGAQSKPCFSSATTWKQLSTSLPFLPWTKSIWFSQSVPRYAFISWLAVLDRLSTGSRMRIWGRLQACILCGEPDETRDHLFFACPYSFTIWSELTTPLLHHRVNPDWAITLRAIRHPSHRRLDAILLRLCFQSTIYNIWRERNSRIHNQGQHSTTNLRHRIAQGITNRINSLNYSSLSPYHDLLTRWLQLTT